VSKPIEITDRGFLSVISGEKHPSGARFAAHVMRKIGKGVWSLNVEPLNLELEAWNDWNVLNDWNDRVPNGGHLIRAPEFASVSCYLSIALYCPQNCSPPADQM